MADNPSSGRRPYVISYLKELGELSDKYSSFSLRAEQYCTVVEQTISSFIWRLKEPEMKGYVFTVSEESAEQIIHFASETSFPKYLVYYGTSESDPEHMPIYTIVVNCIYDTEPDVLFIHAEIYEIYKVTPDNKISYRSLLPCEDDRYYPDAVEIGGWTEDEDTQFIQDVLCRGGMAASFLAGYAAYRRIHPYYVEHPRELLRKNGNLIRLADTLGGLVTFGYGLPDDEEGAAVIPGNTACCGACVRVLDGAYVLCQFIDPSDMTLAMDMEGLQYRVSAVPAGPADGAPGEKVPLFEPVYEEKEAEKMAAVIRSLWNYYPYSGDMVYILPLSDSLAIITKNPFRDLDVRRAGSGEEVSADDLEWEEKKRYDKVRELFDSMVCF